MNQPPVPNWMIWLATELANAALMCAAVLLAGAIMVYWVRPVGHMLASYQRAHDVRMARFNDER